MSERDPIRPAFSLELITSQLKEQKDRGASGERAALEIIGDCGGKCFPCYAFPLRKERQMNIGEVEICLGAIEGAGFKEIYFSGGEPMLHKEIINACRMAKERGLFVILVSNGYSLDKPEVAREMLGVTDKIEISVRSVNRNVHDNVVLGEGWIDQQPEQRPKMGSFDQAVEALRVLNKERGEGGYDVKLAVNYDLYRSKEQFKGHGISYAIVKMLREKGIVLDGFYAQLIARYGRAKESWGHILREVQIDEDGLIQALNDLGAIKGALGVKEVGLTDDPVERGIIKSLDEVPGKLRDLVVGEIVPAVSPGGRVRKNVVELID